MKNLLSFFLILSLSVPACGFRRLLPNKTPANQIYEFEGTFNDAVAKDDYDGLRMLLLQVKSAQRLGALQATSPMQVNYIEDKLDGIIADIEEQMPLVKKKIRIPVRTALRDFRRLYDERAEDLAGLKELDRSLQKYKLKNNAKIITAGTRYVQSLSILQQAVTKRISIIKHAQDLAAEKLAEFKELYNAVRGDQARLVALRDNINVFLADTVFYSDHQKADFENLRGLIRSDLSRLVRASGSSMAPSVLYRNPGAVRRLQF